MPREAPAGQAVDTDGLTAAIEDARCVSADSPVLLILTGTLQRNLRNGCPLVLDPAGTSYELDRGSSRPRPERPEYQRAMEMYYGDSDAALFVRLPSDGLNDATWAAIRRRLPVTVESGSLTILLSGD